MTSTATNPEEYISSLPADRKEIITRLRETANTNLPQGFAETMSYGMITWVIPFTLYPAGYHCDPTQQLPFLSIASQKNYISVYHTGIYAVPGMLDWFTEKHNASGGRKLDVGKSCIRFRKPEDVPLTLLGELFTKMTPADWIALYEKNHKR